MTLLNFWAAGLLSYVPLVMILIALYCLVRAIRSSNQPAEEYDPTRGWVNSGKKVSIFRLFSFYCFVVLMLAAIYMIISISLDYANVN